MDEGTERGDSKSLSIAVVEVLRPPGDSELTEFGRSVSASEDLVAVGRPAGSDGQEVRIYVAPEFFGAANSPDLIVESADPSNDSLLFGWSVSLFGTTLAVGDPKDDIVGEPESGVVDLIDLGTDPGVVNDWVRITRLSASDAEEDDGLGYSVALDGEILVAGAPGNDDEGLDSGAVYIFARNQGGADGWGQVAKLTASDRAAGDRFGHSVAVSVDTVVVGAPGADEGVDESGAVYIFNRNHGGRDAWGQVTKKTVVTNEAVALGESVAVQVDTLVAGAPGGTGGGGAFIFERNHGGADTWGVVSELSSNDGINGDGFGQAVALIDDTVAVGAPFDDGEGNTYLFRRNEGGADAWGQFAKLAEVSFAGSELGASVALSAEWVYVGGPFAGSSNPGGDPLEAGGVNVWKISGKSWQRFARPRPADPAPDLDFGASVAISGDLAVVGAPGDGELAPEAGAAYIFERNQDGIERWHQVAKLLAGDGALNDHFGFAVAISGDTVLVGAPDAETAGADSGSAYVFSRNQGGVDAWGEVARLSSFDDEAGDRLGFSVSIFGETAIAGAPGDALGVGAAYIFERNRGGLDAWREVVKLSDAGASAHAFGTSVAIHQGRALVGAPAQSNVAGVYYFERNHGGFEAWGQRDARTTSADGDDFGASVDLDFRFMAIGKPGNDNSFNDSGQIFHGWARDDGTLNLTTNGLAVPAASDRFGSSVARTWSAIVAGAPGVDLAGVDSGAAYILEPNAAGTGFVFAEQLGLGETMAGDSFGASVAMSGRTMIIGAPQNDDDGLSGGAVYIVRLDDAPEVDLRLSKTESIEPVVAGSGSGNLVYTLSVTNFGGIVDASGVEIGVELDLPVGVTVDSVTASSGIFDGLIWRLDSLLLSATETLTVELTASGLADLGNDVIGCVGRVLYAEQVLINTGDDRVAESTSIDGEIDLQVEISESIDPVVAGSDTGNLTYVTTVSNHGPDPATNIELSALFNLPAGVTVDSVIASQGSFSGSTWSAGDLAVGANATLIAVLTVAAGAAELGDSIGLTSAVTAAAELLYNNADDSDALSTSVSRQVDLVISHTESVDPVVAGSGPANLTYVTTVRNQGPSDGSGVELEEMLALPSGVVLESVTPSTGSFTDPTWSVGDLAAGADATLTAVLTVEAAAQPGVDVIELVVAVDGVNEPVINPGDDTASESTSIVVPESVIFLDGFDSGDLAAWGLVVNDRR